MSRLTNFATLTFLKVVGTESAKERGATLVEYVLLLALILMVAIGAMRLFGVTLSGSLGHSANAIANASTNG